MDKYTIEKDDLLNYYTQTKQRIDLNIDMNTKKIIGQTKLTFEIKKDKENLKVKMPQILYLYLNGENMYINNIKILKNEQDKIKKEKDEKNMSFSEKNLKNLEFKNTSPVCYYKSYLDYLFQNIEELDSYKNIKRVEWEIRKKGNLIIKIPKFFYLDENISDNINNKENIEHERYNYNLLIKKIKIIINYILIEKNIGIIFQEFNEYKKDISYTICYTPNFYYNTQYWVPCIYNLNLRIKWSLYLYIPDEYISYSSCLLNQIIKNNNGKKLIIYKDIEKTTARNIGFILFNKKYFESYINDNFIIVYNKNKKDYIEKYLVNNKLIENIYKFYAEFFNINNKNNSTSTAIIFIPYLLWNNPFQGFKKFIKLKEDNYFSFIKFPYLYILPEKYIYNPNILEISQFQLKILYKLFITNYIEGLIIEKSYADFWIINGLENWISDLFLNKLNNNNYIKIKIYKWLLKLKKECKNGKETLPLYTNNFSNPVEVQLNPIINLKSKIIFHILEQNSDKIIIKNILNEIINERETKGCYISSEILIDKFKKNGIDVNNFFELFIYRTGMIEVNINYKYDINNNIFEYNLRMENISKKYYDENPYFNIGNIDNDFLKKIGKNIPVIDSRIKPIKLNDIKMDMEITQRNGIELTKEIHKINNKIVHEKFSLSIEPRKSEIIRVEKEFFDNLIENTGINDIYKKEEIEKILLENPILWVSNDPGISYFRINKIKQKHILFDYIRIFKDDDYLGKFQSLYNIGKDSENFEKSLQILKYFIKNENAIYHIKKYALKIYVKILIKLKKEDGYLFLLDLLDNYFEELLKSKKEINSNIYKFMNEIIKSFGEYNEKNFDKLESSINKKITDKFLSVLTKNEFDNILKYDNCYFISNIILICSELNLKDKSFVLMDIILKYLRIEKFKRSFNEILIISSIFALNNLLIKYNFFCFQTNIKFKEILSQIFFEINFFMNNDCENYELLVILQYFHIFMEFYKCHSYIEFSNYIIIYILGEEYNSVDKMSNFSINQNLDMISKIKALNFFIINNNFEFDSLSEKIVFLSSIKTILYSPICYLREDCRYILENLYHFIFNKEISSKGAGNNNFNNVNFLHLFNKNRKNFASKKYADQDMILSFINEDDSSIKLKEQILNYNKKYNNISDDIFNLEINTKKSFHEILFNLFNKLIEYSNSLNYLGALAQKDEDKNTILEIEDFKNIKDKIINKLYLSFEQFNKELILLFKNYQSLNKENSLINKIEQLKNYYEIIVFKYKDIITLKEKEEQVNEVKYEDEDTFQEINESYKNKKFLNKKRKLKCPKRNKIIKPNN